MGLRWVPPGGRGLATPCSGRGLGVRLLRGVERAAHGLSDQTGADVWVNVSVRAAVLDVALAFLRHLPRDADGGAAIRDAVAELLVRAGLVAACQALFDTVAVAGDVDRSLLAQGFAR